MRRISRRNMPPANADKPLVSVIIVNYNGGDITLKSIVSVLNSDYPNLEVIVVDNGSTDGSVEKVEKLGSPQVKVIKLGRNTGFSFAKRRRQSRKGALPLLFEQRRVCRKACHIYACGDVQGPRGEGDKSGRSTAQACFGKRSLL